MIAKCKEHAQAAGFGIILERNKQDCPYCKIDTLLARVDELDKLSTEYAILGVRLRWQTEPPKVAGWYWISFNGKTSVREFDQPVIDQLAEEETKPEYKELAARGNFFWAGPIPEPESAT